MQNISIKSGTTATISISPKIGGATASADQLAGVSIYVFFVYQFTNKIYKVPYVLNASNLQIKLTPADTIEMLGNASENQKFELQFAIEDAEGNVISDKETSDIVINIVRWEAGQWLQESKKS